MKVLIIGGGAGGASCAAKLRRLDETAEILVLEKTPENSVASCGLPYYVGGVIEDRADMLAASPLLFKKLFNIEVKVNTEVVSVHIADKHVMTTSGDVYDYDKLVLATGSRAVIPQLKGLDNLPYFALKTLEDADKIKKYIAEHNVKTALIIGGGFSGIELVDNFHILGIKTTVVEAGSQILPVVDEDMVRQLEKTLRDNGVNLILNQRVEEILPDGAKLANGEKINAQMVVFSLGNRPNAELAQNAGIELENGFIKVDDYMQTSTSDVYACGDCATTKDFVSGATVGGGMAGPANRQGRLIACHIAGKPYKNTPTLWTGVLKVFDKTVAFCGHSEAMLKKYNVAHQKMIVWTTTHAGYYPNAEWIALKVMFDEKSGKIFGAQAVGADGVDKRINVISTIMRLNGTVEDLRDAELCYAPPYSNAKDAINLIGMAIENIRQGQFKPYFGTDFDGFTVLDVRSRASYAEKHIEGAINIPAGQLRDRMAEIPRDKPLLVHCYRGYSSYVVVRILMQNGFKDVFSYAGGWQQYEAETLL